MEVVVAVVLIVLLKVIHVVAVVVVVDGCCSGSSGGVEDHSIVTSTIDARLALLQQLHAALSLGTYYKDYKQAKR